MKTKNEISLEIYGKPYAALPDDGAEQDYVAHEYVIQPGVITGSMVREIIGKNMESDLPDRVIEALRPYDGKNITTRMIEKLPALPNGGKWYLIRHYGWTSLQTSTYGKSEGYAGGTSLDLILARSEASVPLDVDYVAGKKPLGNNKYGENCSYFSARVERNEARKKAMADVALLEATGEAMTNYKASIESLRVARETLDNMTDYGTSLHPEQYTLRGIVDPHNKAEHEEKK